LPRDFFLLTPDPPWNAVTVVFYFLAVLHDKIKPPKKCTPGGFISLVIK